MVISEGDRLPHLGLRVVEDGQILDTSTDPLLGAGRHVVFGLPGAFTPTCSAKHLPGFIARREALVAKGVGRVACLAVNDAFVMKAWAEQKGAHRLTMIADGNADFTRALGLEMDASDFYMGRRCQRFAMVVEDGLVRHLMVEAPGDFSVSSAEAVLRALG
jgi:peroxiredoxin